MPSPSTVQLVRYKTSGGLLPMNGANANGSSMAECRQQLAHDMEKRICTDNMPDGACFTEVGSP